MNFLPKNTFVGTNSDGSSYRVHEWNYFDLLRIDLMGGMFLLILSIIFGAVISPIMIIMCILSYNGVFKIGYILCIIISSMFLYDCYSGWLATITLSFFFSESIMNFLVMLNIASIALSVFFTLFGRTFFKFLLSKNNVGAGQGFFLIIGLIMFFSYLYSYSITDKNPGWLNRNIGIEQPANPGN
jgi:hypothetical protein